MLRGPIRFTNALAGTVDFIYPGPAIDMQSPASANAANGATYVYYAQSLDMSQWEEGSGVYTSSSGTFARTTIFANSLGTTAKINFTNPPQIMVRDTANSGLAALMRNYISGCILSNDAVTPNTKIDVSAGAMTDDTNVSMFSVAAGVIDCGTVGANGIDAGSLPASGTVHIFAIAQANGTTAFLASTSLSPTMPTGYTLKRRIGSMLTDSSAHFLKFKQYGDTFLLDVLINNVSGFTGSTAIQTATMSVPLGIQVEAKIVVLIVAGTGGDGRGFVFSPDINSIGALSTSVQTLNFGGYGGVGYQWISEFHVRTDTSRQIKYATFLTSASVYITTAGWVDRLGRDA